MEEFEPKKKVKIFTKEFMMKYSYVFIIALVLIIGVSYSYTFFVENRKIASGSITTANLTINFTDRSISASNLSVPTDDQEGMGEYSKSVTITNQTAIDGKVTLTLTRTSGLNLTDMRYALIVNGAIQTIDDVPANGEILETAIMGNETTSVEVKIWPKLTYSGSETTFVGELTPEIKYLGPVASSVSNLTGKYVQFNCNGNTCENWQVVKVENGRVVLTKPADYSGATERTNLNKFNPDSFNPAITFNDDSLITSLSTDGKNVYLAKTVKITGGSGTQADPYIFENTIFNEEDRKVVAVITYKDDNNTTIGTQNIYYNETNYISKEFSNPNFQGWTDGTNEYSLGDIMNINSDIILTPVIKLPSTLTISNNSVTLIYGTNGQNTYTYNGDGALSCSSSDTTKVTCSIDTANNRVVLVPVAITTSNVTITVSGVDGTNYIAPTNVTFTVIVENIYTIQYVLNGGTVSNTNPTQYTVLDSNFQLNNPTKTGYVFAGWSGTGLSERVLNMTLDTSIRENCVFTANWKKQIDNNEWWGGDHLGYFRTLPITERSCSVNDFLVNSENNKIVVYSNFSGTCSTIYPLVWKEGDSPTWTPATSRSSTIDGRSFNYYYASNITASGPYNLHFWYSNGEKTYLTEIVEYAMDGSHAINYNGNGGTVGTARRVYYPGWKVDISNSNATRSGYTMLGWSEDTDGDIYILYKMQGGKHPNVDITLYAQWVRNSN